MNHKYKCRPEEVAAARRFLNTYIDASAPMKVSKEQILSVFDEVVKMSPDILGQLFRIDSEANAYTVPFLCGMLLEILDDMVAGTGSRPSSVKPLILAGRIAISKSSDRVAGLIHEAASDVEKSPMN
jgi:hypothetical protein